MRARKVVASTVATLMIMLGIPLAVVAPAFAAGCAPTMVYFVPGTTETNDNAGTGPRGMLTSVANRIQSEYGSQVGTRFISYPAQAFSGGKTYDASRQIGVNNLISAMGECPNSRKIPVGYSQGAAVAGDVLAQAGQGKLPDLGKILGGSLLADPRNGTAGQVDRGAGKATGIGGGRAGGFGSLSGKVFSVCNPKADDMWCNTSAQQNPITSSIGKLLAGNGPTDGAGSGAAQVQQGASNAAAAVAGITGQQAPSASSPSASVASAVQGLSGAVGAPGVVTPAPAVPTAPVSGPGVVRQQAPQDGADVVTQVTGLVSGVGGLVGPNVQTALTGGKPVTSTGSSTDLSAFASALQPFDFSRASLPLLPANISSLTQNLTSTTDSIGQTGGVVSPAQATGLTTARTQAQSILDTLIPVSGAMKFVTDNPAVNKQVTEAPKDSPLADVRSLMTSLTPGQAQQDITKVTGIRDTIDRALTVLNGAGGVTGGPATAVTMSATVTPTAAAAATTGAAAAPSTATVPGPAAAGTVPQTGATVQQTTGQAATAGGTATPQTGVTGSGSTDLLGKFLDGVTTVSSGVGGGGGEAQGGVLVDKYGVPVSNSSQLEGNSTEHAARDRQKVFTQLKVSVNDAKTLLGDSVEFSKKSVDVLNKAGSQLASLQPETMLNQMGAMLQLFATLDVQKLLGDATSLVRNILIGAIPAAHQAANLIFTMLKPAAAISQAIPWSQIGKAVSMIPDTSGTAAIIGLGLQIAGNVDYVRLYNDAVSLKDSLFEFLETGNLMVIGQAIPAGVDLAAVAAQGATGGGTKMSAAQLGALPANGAGMNAAAASGSSFQVAQVASTVMQSPSAGNLFDMAREGIQFGSFFGGGAQPHTSYAQAGTGANGKSGLDTMTSDIKGLIGG